MGVKLQSRRTLRKEFTEVAGGTSKGATTPSEAGRARCVAPRLAGDPSSSARCGRCSVFYRCRGQAGSPARSGQLSRCGATTAPVRHRRPQSTVQRRPQGSHAGRCGSTRTTHSSATTATLLSPPWRAPRWCSTVRERAGRRSRPPASLPSEACTCTLAPLCTCCRRGGCGPRCRSRPPSLCCSRCTRRGLSRCGVSP